MKKIVIILAMAAFLFGCDKEFSSDNLNDDVFTVNLTLSGEVSVTEEPLTKSISSNDLVGIQVYQNDVPYAYGLFDDASKMSINLHTEKKYIFKSQLIKEGKKSLARMSTSSGNPCYYPTGGLKPYTSNVYKSYGIISNMCHIGTIVYYFPYSSGYGNPFSLNEISMSTGYSNYTEKYYVVSSGKRDGPFYIFENKLPDSVITITDITNRFVYDNTMSMDITNSSVMFNNSSSIDRYYGESDTFTASPGSGTIILNMKHLVYGLQCNVTGVSDGTASVTIKNGDNTLLEKADISGEYHSEKMMFGFSDMHSAWQYSDDYSENVTVSLTWHRGVGITQDLGSAVVQVKRNCMNVINVSLSTTTKACATLGVESEQSDMNIISIDSNTHF